MRPLLVLLGASNLTRGIASAAVATQRVLGPSLEVLAAIGHGRSYGTTSRVLVRSLPGIVDCGLWSALESRRSADRPVYALVTDVGNDVLYGYRPETIAAWVQTCLDRLQAAEARIVLTRLPIGTIRDLSPTRFRFVSNLLFPGHGIAFETAIARSEALDEHLAHLAAERGIDAPSPDPSWYGFDPVHVRRRQRPAAWSTFLAPWGPAAHPTPAGGALRRWLRLRLATPERWWLAGREQGSPQPSVRIDDGTRVSLF